MYNRQIKTFINVADCGSFAKAGEKANLSPTAVMKQINELEYRLGLKLFARTPQGVRLTPAGQSVYKDAKFMIDYANQAVIRAKNAEDAARSVLRVGTSLLNPCKVFMDLWNKVCDSFPLFRIQIVPFEDDNRNILSVIKNIGRKFDFIVGACSSEQWLNICSFYQLGTYKICCAVPRTHRLASKSVLEISDLYGEKLLMVKRGDAVKCDELRDDLEKNHPQIIIEDTPQFYDIEVFNYCERTNAVLLTLDVWQDVHPFLKTIPVNWPYTMPYGLLYPRTPGKNIRDFLQLLPHYVP